MSLTVEVIPEGWATGTIASIADINPKCDTSQLKEDTLVTFVPMQNVSEDGHIISRDRKKYSEVKSGFTCFHEGDVLFAKITPCMENGKGALVSDLINKTGFGSTEFFVLRAKESQSREYLYQLSRSPMIRHSAGCFMTGTAGQQRVSRSIFDLVKINIPPLPEQRRIAAILSTIDGAIQRSRQAVAETERLKAGVMHELMTKGIGHTEFREDPDVGRVPKEWVVSSAQKLLSDNFLLQIQDGNHGELYPRNKDFGDIGRPFIAASQIDDYGNIDFKSAPKLPEIHYKKLRIGFGKSGDIILAHNATVGKVGIAPVNSPDFIASTSTTIYRVNSEKIDNNYLFQFLRSSTYQNQLGITMKQSTRNQVPITKQKELFIIVPPVIEQQKIATILTKIDRKLTLQRQRTTHYGKLKQGLMNELLTGKRRVMQNTNPLSSEA